MCCACAWTLLQVRAQGGQAWWYSFQITPIFTYNFPTASLPYYGAFHGAEVPFVFGVPAELSSDGERAASKAMGCGQPTTVSILCMCTCVFGRQEAICFGFLWEGPSSPASSHAGQGLALHPGHRTPIAG